MILSFFKAIRAVLFGFFLAMGFSFLQVAHATTQSPTTEGISISADVAKVYKEPASPLTIANDLCKKHSNYGKTDYQKAVGESTTTVTAEEQCIEVVKAEVEYQRKTEEDDKPEDCKQVKEDFRQYSGVCKAIAVKDILGSKENKIDSKLVKCQLALDKCTEMYADKDKEKKEECSFMAKKGISDEALQDVASQISDEEKDIQKQMLDSQNQIVEKMKSKQEDAASLQQQMLNITNEMSKIGNQIIENSLKNENAKTEAKLELNNKLSALQAELGLAQGTGLFDIEADYDARMLQEKQACFDEGTKMYTSYKNSLQTLNASGKGLSNAQLSKYAKRTPEKWVDSFATKCLNSTAYLAKVKKYNQDRVSALAAQKIKIEKIQSDIRNTLLAVSEQTKAIDTNDQVQKNMANQRLMQLEQQQRLLQQKLAKIQQPDSSSIMSQMQSQQILMSRLQSLNALKQKHDGLENINLDKDDFKSFSAIMGLEVKDNEARLKADYDLCTASTRSRSSNGSAEGSN